jgi:uncharacterized membrane protein YfcA
MIPLLYYVPPLLGAGELPLQHVAGLSMTQVLAAALVGTWSHGRHAFVHRRLALTGGPAMAAGSLLGALGSSHVSARALLATFAVMATVALPLMFLSPADPPGGDTRGPAEFSRAAAVTYSGGIGLVAGLVGAGGAFLLVPVMVGLMRVPMRVSIGTSLAMVGISAVTGFLGKALTGQVPLWPAVPVAVLRGVLASIITLVMLRVWYDVVW